ATSTEQRAFGATAGKVSDVASGTGRKLGRAISAAGEHLVDAAKERLDPATLADNLVKGGIGGVTEDLTHVASEPAETFRTSMSDSPEGSSGPGREAGSASSGMTQDMAGTTAKGSGASNRMTRPGERTSAGRPSEGDQGETGSRAGSPGRR